MGKALLGLSLLAIGALLAYLPGRDYTERRVVADAGTCRVDMDVVQKTSAAAQPDSGAVILLHGLSANKGIMSYLARSMAEIGLTVYVPDLPGHGRTSGPFSPDLAEACSLSLIRGMAARGLILPSKTILMGHSMGGAIALRIAPTIRPAGVIAISPAPMRTTHGVTKEKLLYPNPPKILPNTLIFAGQFEPQGLAANAADLAAEAGDSSIQFKPVLGNSHVSVLFSPTAARDSQMWAARVLNLRDTGQLPSKLPLLGCGLGLLGILLIAGPFLNEMLPEKPAAPATTEAKLPGAMRLLIEVALVSILVVGLLHYIIPLRVIGLFEGDYLASFFLVAGFLLIFLHAKLAQKSFPAKPAVLIAAAFSALVLHLLISGWFDITATGAWMNTQRWVRFPLFFLAAFCFLFALEAMLGPVVRPGNRLALDCAAILVAWLAMVAAVFVLHSGEILLVLLMPYFVISFFFSRLGARLVRARTGSATAAAIFGAILLAGFSLVLFPVT